MNVAVSPSVPTGEIALPASKSVAHRALIAAACSDKPCLLSGRFVGDDVSATAECLRRLGATVETVPDGLLVSPIASLPAKAELYVGASGSTLRFMLPVAVALGVETSFSGTERLAARPIGDLIEELVRHGATASSLTLPLTLGGKINEGVYRVNAGISSQFITGLMLALPIVGGGKIVTEGKIVSKNYLDVTASVMRSFGVRVEEENGVFTVCGKYRSPSEFSVESDWSSAAFFAVCGVLGKGVTLTGLNLRSTQGDKAILDCLKNSGAEVVTTEKTVLIKRGNPKPFVFDVQNCPDAAPALGVLAATASGKSVLTGTERLKIKESDRSAEIVSMLRAFGAEATDYGDRIEIIGTGRLRGCKIDLPDDHRMAMSAAVAASVAEGDSLLVNAECVSKSYPIFFDDFVKLGGKADVQSVL